jgi:hypothetical protein
MIWGCEILNYIRQKLAKPDPGWYQTVCENPPGTSEEYSYRLSTVFLQSSLNHNPALAPREGPAAARLNLRKPIVHTILGEIILLGGMELSQSLRI